MNCVIKIGDREAVPVRAIPFVTGWSISPDVVARGLAGLDFNRRLKSLRAYHLDLDGNFSPMLPKEWDVIYDGLRALSASLRAGETFLPGLGEAINSRPAFALFCVAG